METEKSCKIGFAITGSLDLCRGGNDQKKE